jgi:hypothetical protein
MDYFTNPEKQPMTTCVILGLTLLVLLYKASKEHFEFTLPPKVCEMLPKGTPGCPRENFGLATDAAKAFCRYNPTADICQPKPAEPFYYRDQPQALAIGQGIDNAAAKVADVTGQGLQYLGKGLQNLAK